MYFHLSSRNRARIKKEEKTPNGICKKQRPKKECALTGVPAEQCFRNGDLRECLYIVNFDTTIETDTFLWRSLRLIWCSCQGAKRGAAGN